MKKKSLGDFCEQFGLKQTLKKSHIKKKSLIRPAFLKPKGKYKKETKTLRPKAKVKKERNFKAKSLVCHKCDRIRHYVNSYWIQDRIN